MQFMDQNAAIEENKQLKCDEKFLSITSFFKILHILWQCSGNITSNVFLAI